MSGCGSEACGCGQAPIEEGETKGGGRLANHCPRCSNQGHPVPVAVLPNILKAEAIDRYRGDTPTLCLNPSCGIVYFDLGTGEILQNEDCAVGIWFKDNAPPSYVCYCEKITEKEVIETVVETGLEDLGSVMLYLREGIGEECETKQPASIPCRQYFQDAIEKAQIVREALTSYQHLQTDSKEVPYDLIEERYKQYLMDREGSLAEAGKGCGGGACPSCS